jgi:hypothetical protein
MSYVCLYCALQTNQSLFAQLWKLVEAQQSQILKANAFLNYMRPEIDGTGKAFIRVSLKDANQAKNLALPDTMIPFVRIVEEPNAPSWKTSQTMQTNSSSSVVKS